MKVNKSCIFLYIRNSKNEISLYVNQCRVIKIKKKPQQIFKQQSNRKNREEIMKCENKSIFLKQLNNEEKI